MANVLHTTSPPMSRKSQPQIDPGLQLRVVPTGGERNDRTLVDNKAPAVFPEGTHHERGKAEPQNVIPFARPRAIANLPTTFSTPIAGRKEKRSPRSTPAPSFAPPVRPAGHPGRTSQETAETAAVNLATATKVAADSVKQLEAVKAPAITSPTAAATPMAPAVTPQPPARDLVIAWPTVAPMMPPPTIAVQQPMLPPLPPATLAPPRPFVPDNVTLSFNATTVFPRTSVPLPPEHLDEEPKPTNKWASFEKLGLRAPKALAGMSKHVVSTYRLLGFLILTIIVVVLIGYIATTAFFYMSDSWIVPMAISPTDEKVVALQAQLAERQNNRDKIAADLDDANRAITVQQAFQAEFAKAIKSDLEGRKAALAKMHELAQVAASTRSHIRASNSAYAAQSQNQMANEWKAGLIDRQAMLAGKFQLAQITSSNLSLAERQAEYETRAADLTAQTHSLDALLANTADDGALSYDVLKIKQDYEASRLETQKAIEARDTLKQAVDREDKLIKSLAQSSYLRALADHGQVAFVPYGNLHKVEKGGSLYGCRLGMIICHKVGTVLEVLPGEVQFKHPHRDQMLRGQMVELQMEDADAATDDVLFVGGKPLFI